MQRVVDVASDIQDGRSSFSAWVICGPFYRVSRKQYHIACGELHLFFFLVEHKGHKYD